MSLFDNPFRGSSFGALDNSIGKSLLDIGDVQKRMQAYYNSVLMQPPPPIPAVAIESHAFRTSILRQRMRWMTDEGPLQALYTHYIKAEQKVVLFVVYRDKSIVMEDDALMFPSDTLVTQMRLLTE